MSCYPVHPFADTFPLLDAADFAELVESIRTIGLLHPIMLDRGVILDGRHRLLACERAGVEPRFTEFTGDSATAYILGANCARRNLSTVERAKTALDSLPFFAAEAAARQMATRAPKGGGVVFGGISRKPSEVRGNEARGIIPLAVKQDESQRALAQAAAAFKAPVDTTRDLFEVRRKSPEVEPLVVAGQATMADGLRASKLPADKRAVVVEAVVSGKAPNLKEALKGVDSAPGGAMDALGRSLPAEIAATYAADRAVFDRAISLSQQLVGELGKLTTQGMWRTGAREAREQVQLLGKFLRSEAPATTCPHCKLIPELRAECGACEGGGVASERVFRAAIETLQIGGPDAVVLVDGNFVRVADFSDDGK